MNLIIVLLLIIKLEYSVAKVQVKAPIKAPDGKKICFGVLCDPDCRTNCAEVLCK